MTLDMEPLLLRAARQGMDLCLSENRAPFLKGRGTVEYVTGGEFVERDTLFALLRPRMDTKSREQWTANGNCRFRWQGNAGNFRVDLARESQGVVAVFRPVLDSLPTLDMLNVPPAVKSLLSVRNGLILFCGPGFSGTTTLSTAFSAALCEQVPLRVRVLDPDPEWVVPSGCSLLVRGIPTQGLDEDIASASMAGTDVFVFGDVFVEQMGSVLDACAGGALVIANLRASSAVHALERILPENPSLARVLRAVVFCHLLPAEGTRELLPVWDVLFVNRAVIQTLESQDFSQLLQVQKNAVSEGMVSLDESLLLLVSQGRISKGNAKMWAHEPMRFA